MLFIRIALVIVKSRINGTLCRYSVNTRAEAVPGSEEGTIVSTLSVTIRTADEGGRYGCNATNSQGSHAHQARLNVYGRLTMTERFLGR